VASRRKEHQEDAKLRLMQMIKHNPELTSREIAKKIGISNGSAHYVLKALIEKGFVRLESFSNHPRKRQYAYLLTPKGIG